MVAAYLVNILCMSLSAEEQHSQTVLDTPELGERGWEYWEDWISRTDSSETLIDCFGLFGPFQKTL